MRFLDTDDIHINSKMVYTFLQPIIPNSLTMGLLCLTGGISYYSWNYYKNKSQELNVKTIEKEEEKKYDFHEIKENTSFNSNNATHEAQTENQISEYEIFNDNNS